MFFGGISPIVIAAGDCGILMKKRFLFPNRWAPLHTDTMGFPVILVFVVYIFAALTFFPVLALGPIAEHLTLWA